MLLQIVVLSSAAVALALSAGHLITVCKMRRNRLHPDASADATRKTMNQRFWRLDRVRVRCLCGIFVCYAVGTYLTAHADSCSSWRCHSLTWSNLAVAALFLLNMLAVVCYGNLRDVGPTSRYMR